MEESRLEMSHGVMQRKSAPTEDSSRRALVCLSDMTAVMKRDVASSLVWQFEFSERKFSRKAKNRSHAAIRSGFKAGVIGLT
jgi:hypothetical protein